MVDEGPDNSIPIRPFGDNARARSIIRREGKGECKEREERGLGRGRQGLVARRGRQ